MVIQEPEVLCSRTHSWFRLALPPVSDPGRVIPDFADLHPGGRLSRRRNGKDHAEQDYSENQQPAH